MILEAIRKTVENDFAAMQALMVQKIESQIGLIDEMSHHLIEGGGKRLRPLLVLLSSKACGYEGDNHIPLATAIEFLHTATLLHDDVVDESTLRRGRQTANTLWGSKASILVGDYLFSLSIDLITQAGNSEIIQLLANTSLEMSTGEVKQLMNKHNPGISFEEYFEVIRAKTGLLFAAAGTIGPMLCKAPKTLQDSLYAYSLHLGNAFQLIDDALDYCGDHQAIGKNLGDDLADGKMTLPLIHAMQNGSETQKEQIRVSLKQGSLVDLPVILAAIEETKAIAYTKQKAADEIDLALTKLSVLPASIYQQALQDLALFALNRTH